MKKITVLFLLVGVMGFLTFSAQAANIQEQVEKNLNIEAVEEALSDETERILGKMSITDKTSVETGFTKLMENAGLQVGGIFRETIIDGAIIVTVSICCVTAEAVFIPEGKNKYPFVQFAGVFGVAAVAAGNLTRFTGLGISILDELNVCSKALLPTLAAAASASGAITSSAAKYAAAALVMDIFMTIGRNIIMPLIYAHIGASVAEAALGGKGLTGAVKLIKWVTVTVMTITVLVFVIYLSLTGIVSASTDAATSKMAKATISTVLPVVGGIVSDAASAIVGAASMIRNAAGVFGLLAVCTICLTPFLKLGIHYLIYKAAAALVMAISNNNGIAKVVSSIAASFGMIMGLVGTSAIMLFFSILSLMKAVVG